MSNLVETRVAFSVKFGPEGRAQTGQTGVFQVAQTLDEEFYRSLNKDQQYGGANLKSWISRNLFGEFIGSISPGDNWTIVEPIIYRV